MAAQEYAYSYCEYHVSHIVRRMMYQCEHLIRDLHAGLEISIPELHDHEYLIDTRPNNHLLDLDDMRMV